MLDFSPEAVLLRRKLYVERGYRPVPVDRTGNPVVPVWREQALEDPPRSTVAPVDRNSPVTALLAGELIAVEVASEDPDAVSHLAGAVEDCLGVTPLVRRGSSGIALLYRSARALGETSIGAWHDSQNCRVEALITGPGIILVELDPQSGAPYDWLRTRPDETTLGDLPELDDVNKALTALEERLREAGYERSSAELFDELELVETEPPPLSNGCKDGPPEGPPAPPAGEPPDGPPLPKIIVVGGQRHRAADRGLAALYRARAPFFNRSGELVRVTMAPVKDSEGRTFQVPAITPVPFAALARALGQSARWYRLNPQKVPYAVDPPAPVVEMIAAMADRWKFPPLLGLIRTPTLRPNFTVLDRPGYDLQTGMFVDLGSLVMPRISDRPSRSEAEAALKSLLQVLDFPFVDERDRAAAVAAMLTAVVRPALETSPLFLVTAPVPGSGKSYLVDCIAAVATGDRAAVIAVAPKEEETEKRLIGAALLGNPIICLDNVRRLLQGDFLCQVTERPLLQLRPLGTSEVRQIRNLFTTFANGNNVVAADDMVRRSLGIALDANVERPELREFDGDPRLELLDHRGHYIAHCLTVVRYYHFAGRPNLRPRLGSYGQWSDTIRSALTHLGLPDCVGTQEALRVDDPVTSQRAAVFRAWRDFRSLLPEDPRGWRVKDLIEEASRDPGCELFEALLDVAEGQGPNTGKIDRVRLGLWLGRNEGAIAVGVKLGADRSDERRLRWLLAPVVPNE
jgi:putative DNA primase/helicase